MRCLLTSCRQNAISLGLLLLLSPKAAEVLEASRLANLGLEAVLHSVGGRVSMLAHCLSTIRIRELAPIPLVLWQRDTWVQKRTECRRAVAGSVCPFAQDAVRRVWTGFS